MFHDVEPTQIARSELFGDQRRRDSMPEFGSKVSQYLCLEGTLVGDEIAVMARNWPALRTLDLGYTPVSDAAIESLAALPATLVLGLTGSLVTEAGFLRLQRLLPKAAIHWKPTLSVLGWWRPETPDHRRW